jgi:ketosteroid isomerase-like protein
MTIRPGTLRRYAAAALLAATTASYAHPTSAADVGFMSTPGDLKHAIEQHHVAVNEFVRGNVIPWKEHCSHLDDVTIVGGWGGFEKGWAAQVEKRYDWAVARFKGVESAIEFENISLVVTPELAYSIDIERGRVRLAGREDFAPMALRVTTIFRRENGAWKMVHRHADPLLGVQTADSVTRN